MHYTLARPPEADRAWPSMARLRIATRAIFGSPGIFKREGLIIIIIIIIAIIPSRRHETWRWLNGSTLEQCS